MIHRFLFFVADDPCQLVGPGEKVVIGQVLLGFGEEEKRVKGLCFFPIAAIGWAGIVNAQSCVWFAGIAFAVALRVGVGSIVGRVHPVAGVFVPAVLKFDSLPLADFF
jgi:hypothetical protein